MTAQKMNVRDGCKQLKIGYATARMYRTIEFANPISSIAS